MSETREPDLKPLSRGSRVVYALVPLVALAVVVVCLLRYGPDWIKLGDEDNPDVEEISFTWTTLSPNEIKLDIVNNGPDPVTIAQVLVDEAYWNFKMEPRSKILERLQSGVITINYPWVKYESHAVRLITRNGVTFDTEIAVAVNSPKPNPRSFTVFVILGIVIGVIPVALGLMWYPVLRDVSAGWVRFLSAFTVGLLIFLLIDTVEHGLKVAKELPHADQGTALLFGVGLLVFAVLMMVDSSEGESAAGTGGWSRELKLAFLIALGIGLHNVGEGLAVGTMYVQGEASKGAALTLVVGFTMHNITEGLAIVIPAAKKGLSIRQLVGLGALAGLPTIAGTLLGGFTYSQFWAVLFFAMAAGAIFQVIFVIARSPAVRSAAGRIALPENVAGLVTGLAVMYGTASQMA